MQAVVNLILEQIWLIINWNCSSFFKKIHFEITRLTGLHGAFHDKLIMTKTHDEQIPIWNIQPHGKGSAKWAVRIVFLSIVIGLLLLLLKDCRKIFFMICSVGLSAHHFGLSSTEQFQQQYNWFRKSPSTHVGTKNDICLFFNILSFKPW